MSYQPQDPNSQYQQQQNPYGQPYPQPAPSYDPSSGQYGQPANPYGQPTYEPSSGQYGQPANPYSQPQYGQPVPPYAQPQQPMQYNINVGIGGYGVTEPPKDWLVALLLCLFLGCLGVHRFYTGHIALGVIQLLTFGGCGIWALVDFILILANSYTDSYGRPLVRR
jgi:hypothetical protein